MKIGLIGLGIMGKPMAKNLLKAGYDLTVNDRSQASVEDVVAAGARYATQQEIGERCDVVLTMLPNSPQVKEVMLAEVQEILQWMHNHEGGQKDHSAIAQYYEHLTGLRIGR